MYIPFTEALFGRSLNAEDLTEHDEFLSRPTEEPFFQQAMTDAEQLLGPLTWLELPAYPAPEVPRSDDPDDHGDFLVRALCGTNEDGCTVIEAFGLPDCTVSRTLWQYGSAGAMEVVQRFGAAHRHHDATIETAVTLGQKGATFTRIHTEHVLGGDEVSARCLTAMQLVRSVRRLKQLKKLDVLGHIVRKEREIAARISDELTALCSGKSPPRYSAPDWEVRLTRYLIHHGVPAEAIVRFLDGGQRPRQLGVSFRWETNATISRQGAFSLERFSVETGNMRTYFPAPPEGAQDQLVYGMEVQSAMALAQLTLSSIPNMEEVARTHGWQIQRRT